ncbi:polysaccharide biosynthesis C-terminal domain-containing protein [Glycomyces sp. TRM65418]|uniref:MATE family efflux transporter n=1 Tax=Glycomyces sp. TRM65418 TaxID=2867006 RepID=UPI001CE599F2|nr:polysaccharide biosynthesis C-terminal domain-containing protein [Glycomyces sp. TRM65418]MCC3764963.1 polysaccharide biosynthesis C-terminal domain-containing protein [Glycomyces sp. TRM65418]QZD54601.1 polysaccharide biosynthesis C-terminal domain-containing protein [Glycomyces sp. TRM65418]
MAALTATAVADEAGREELRGTARGGLVNLAGAAVSGLGGLAVTWLAAVAMSPAEAGAFFAATSVFLLAGATARLGTPTGLVYWVARLHKSGRDGAVGSVLRLGLWPAAIASMAAALALLLTAPMFARPDLVRLIALFLPASVALEALLAATRGYRLMGPTVMIDKLGRTAAQLIGLAAIALAGTASALTITFAWVLPYLPAAFAAGWYLLRRHRRSRPDPGFPDRVSARAFWGFTAPRAAAGVAQLGLQRLDIIMVAALAGLGPAAVYTVATRFVIVGQMASGAVGQSVQPRAAAAMAAGEPASARALYQASTAWIVALTWPVYLAVGLLADWYLRLFGQDYVGGDARLVVWILVPAMMLSSACGVVDSMLAMAGKTSWQLIDVSISLVVNIGLNLALIPSMGVVGAAIAWSAAVLVNNLVPLAQLWRTFGLHPFGALTRRALLAAGLGFGVLPLAAMPLGPLWTSAALAAAGLAWGVALLRYRTRI